MTREAENAAGEARPCPDVEPWPRADAEERPRGTPRVQPALAIPDPSHEDRRRLLIEFGFVKSTAPELRDDTWPRAAEPRRER